MLTLRLFSGRIRFLLSTRDQRFFFALSSPRRLPIQSPSGGHRSPWQDIRYSVIDLVCAFKLPVISSDLLHFADLPI